jgi:adenylosuccinate synthase
MLTKCGKRLFSGVRSGKVTVVTGSQWGDEGKGKLVDVLASGHDIIARCNGGANAGHTIVDCHGNKYAMHQVPSGILQYETVNLIGHGTVLDVEGLFEELAALPTLTSKLLVSDKTPLVLPTHKVCSAPTHTHTHTHLFV